MNQKAEKYLTVKALNRYIAYKFESDSNLKTLHVQGEISNARYSKGHLYFVLKDDESEISAIMFANYVQSLNFEPTDGTKVLVVATLNAYQKKGTYSLSIFSMEQYGIGLMYQKFLMLKEKLEKEGLFAVDKKKKIPINAKNIGVISSLTADALQDILSTITKRFPLSKVHVYPAIVQGQDAPKSIIKMILKANSLKKDDILIIARGGGSFEDLSCFNDEQLARTIYNSDIPIVSGVGHETDFTICDFVSDLRAPTPTGAAVLVTKDKNMIIDEIKSTQNRLNQAIKANFIKNLNAYTALSTHPSLRNFDKVLDSKLQILDHKMAILQSKSPYNKVNSYTSQIENIIERLKSLKFEQKIQDKENQIERQFAILSTNIVNKINTFDNLIHHQVEKLILLNPLLIMEKGYSITYKNDQIVYSVGDLKRDDLIDVRLKDGLVSAKIINIKE